jgi:predicted dehydrogenase
VRVAIVGYGGRGEEQLETLLQGDDRWRVVAVADRSPLAHARLQSRFYDHRIPVVRRAGELLAFEPDAIVVSTTAPGHAPVTLELIEAGLDAALLIEKPLASSVAEGRELSVAVDRWGGRAGVGYQRRCSRMYADAVSLLRSGELGAVRRITYATKKAEMLSMKGSHHIDLANWIAGAPPVEVRGRIAAGALIDRRGARFYDPPGVVEAEYENGVRLRLDTTGEGEKPRLLVQCEGGSLVVDRTETQVTVKRPDGETDIPTDAVGGRSRNAHWSERTMAALVDAPGDVHPCTVAEALTTVEMMSAAYESSARGGEPVRLPLDSDRASLELLVA